MPGTTQTADDRKRGEDILYKIHQRLIRERHSHANWSMLHKLESLMTQLRVERIELGEV